MKDFTMKIFRAGLTHLALMDEPPLAAAKYGKIWKRSFDVTTTTRGILIFNNILLAYIRFIQGRFAHKGQMGQAHPKKFR